MAGVAHLQLKLKRAVPIRSVCICPCPSSYHWRRTVYVQSPLPACHLPTCQAIQTFGRQALHAKRLELDHPTTGERLAWEVELPDDMET